MINVESEHSAMSAAIAAAVAGARTMTATSSQGLALMAEVVYIAASMRAPVVMALGNRALSGPINIHCDHSDSMLIRDSGAIQLFADSAQEAYDLTVLAPRLAEHPDVLLPVIVCVDGFTITHSAEPVQLLDDEQVSDFVGEYRIPHPLLDLADPTTQGPFAMPDYYFELRRQQAAAIEAAQPISSARGSWRTHRPERRPSSLPAEGAERALVCLGSTAGTAKDVVDEFATRGAGRTAPDLLLPAVPLRSDPRGAGRRGRNRGARPGRLARRSAAARPSRSPSRPAPVRSHVYGLGGRDSTPRPPTCLPGPHRSTSA